MYVVYWFEFIWRWFIQGPSLGIKTIDEQIKQYLQLNKTYENIFSPQNGLVIPIITIGVVFIIIVFVISFLKIMIKTKESIDLRMKNINLVKQLILNTMILILFPIVFFLVVIVFSYLYNTFIQIAFNLENDNLFNQIHQTFNQVFGEKINSTMNPPESNNLEILNVNLFFAILYIFSILFFVSWFVFTICQKIIEIFILYLSFPFFVAASISNDGYSRKLWIKELINKMLVCLIVIFTYFLFNFILLSLNTTISTKGNEKMILFSILIFALDFALIYSISYVSKKHKQYSGLTNTFKSFKQTLSFVKENTKQNNFYKPVNIPYYRLDLVNKNAGIIKDEIKILNNNFLDIKSLQKINVMRKK